MLKYTYTLLLIACSAGIGYSQKINTAPGTAKRLFIKNEIDNEYRKNWSTNRLKGHVKTIIQFYYNGPATDTTTPEFQTREYMHYDSKGNLTEHIKQEEDARPDRTIYKYNSDNKWTEMSFYSGNGITDYENYNVFDTKGNLIDEGERYGDGSVHHDRVSEYDQYGGRTKATIPGRVTTFLNTYDKEGLLVLQVNLVNKKFDGKTTWKYDKVGHVIEKAEYAKNGELLARTNTRFNKFHLPDSMVIIRKGYAGNTHIFQYDSLGRGISQGMKDPKTDAWLIKWEFSYEVDAHGNWTKCIEYDTLHATTTTTIRIITYY
ncbi:hypothetical protein [Chitinophaga sp. S165]|uniref:hypothetical protein n=1 Tax=Chitinophaga sp. S165 TaxID=2135462 RepID=UPI000D7124B8|nr:hypothetical protein [Chitinophaga sp. S165]PWV48314.1 hypothetical protein C7475_107222 [Chitinophaga sp. S165]